jgi:lipoprotein-anchoring transpeptidase ErfK/SrfK
MNMKVRRGLVLAVGLALVAAAPAHAQDPPDPPDPPEPPTIADGVRIAGVDVGGLNRADAVAAVRASFHQPLQLRLRDRTRRVAPATLRSGARVSKAVTAALTAAEGSRIGLEVVVKRRHVRRWVAQWARSFDRKPVNSRILLRSGRPAVTKARRGRKLGTRKAIYRVSSALRRHRRDLVTLPWRVARASVKRGNIGPVVVIRRGSRSLFLYRGVKRRGGMGLVRVFRVAVGQPAYPTPTGRFRIVSKQRNPWWYPPNTGWASGAKPIPPGPGNPLGTRWMGLSVGAVGIHGTYNSASIGGFASHGCIRMYLHQAEWLYERVRIGTTVFIRAA